jgi:hypothetical protein
VDHGGCVGQGGHDGDSLRWWRDGGVRWWRGLTWWRSPTVRIARWSLKLWGGTPPVLTVDGNDGDDSVKYGE